MREIAHLRPRFDSREGRLCKTFTLSLSISIHHYPSYSHHIPSCFITIHQIPSNSILLKHVPSWNMFHCVSSYSIMFHSVPSCFIMLHHVPWCFIMFQHVSSYSIMFHSVPLCFIMSYFNILQCDLASTLNFCSWLDGEWDGAAAEQANDTANDIVTRCGKGV